MLICINQKDANAYKTTDAEHVRVTWSNVALEHPEFFHRCFSLLTLYQSATDLD